MTRAKDISKIVTDADLSGTLDVTGAVTTGGNVGINESNPSSSLHIYGSTPKITLEHSNENGTAQIYTQSQSGIILDADPDNTDNGTPIQLKTDGKARLLVEDSGDISFYEDTGTTPKLFWDASAECLNVGTPTSAGRLHVNVDAASDYPVRFVNSSSTGYGLSVTAGNNNTSIARFKDYAGNDRVHILGNGNVGIGTSSPDTNLDIERSSNDTGGIKVQNTNNSQSNAVAQVEISGGDNAYANLLLECNSTNHSIRQDGSGNLKFINASTESVRIDQSGNLLVGTTSLMTDFGDGRTTVAIKGTGTADYAALELGNNATTGDTQILGVLAFHDNTARNAQINAQRDGGTNEASLNFYTADAGVLGNRMTIKSDGNVFVGITTNPVSQSGTTTGGQAFIANSYSAFSRVGGVTAYFNRQYSDGDIIAFRQDGNDEGFIRVSGSTVTLIGGHLSRLSRLTGNNKDTSIVKGTVMTNLDEMIEWSHEEVLWTDEDELPDGVSVGDVKKDAYTEENEQLNKMAVSSVEGDINVAGVFGGWHNDDDGFNDMVIAMTGDMVIRIAQGTTVARGDLLMSAGDGTAKPQGDDIVRSKTIAKVTSTNVSHTYDNGTYLVPCVLMAC